VGYTHALVYVYWELTKTLQIPSDAFVNAQLRLLEHLGTDVGRC